MSLHSSGKTPKRIRRLLRKPRGRRGTNAPVKLKHTVELLAQLRAEKAAGS